MVQNCEHFSTTLTYLLIVKIPDELNAMFTFLWKKSIIYTLIITNIYKILSHSTLQHKSSSHVGEWKPIKLKTEDFITISKVQTHNSHYGNRLLKVQKSFVLRPLLWPNTGRIHPWPLRSRASIEKPQVKLLISYSCTRSSMTTHYAQEQSTLEYRFIYIRIVAATATKDAPYSNSTARKKAIDLRKSQILSILGAFTTGLALRMARRPAVL